MLKPQTCGWYSSFEEFCKQNPVFVRENLKDFVGDASSSQISAWDESIPMLQQNEQGIISERQEAAKYSNVLEYQLPLESRRIDVVMLGNGAVVVIELKGKDRPTQADLDQVSAYARDLRCYHKDCADRPVYSILIPTRFHGPYEKKDDIYIVAPNRLKELFTELLDKQSNPPISPESFLDSGSYSPLPTLVQAARELFEKKELRTVRRAWAVTNPAVERILEIFREAAETKTRHLVLLTGVPGSGKTLVGLRLVHDRSLDKLAVERSGGKPSAPAVFLSGNGPLVKVLQYVLRSGGGEGKTFVRDVKNYREYYSKTQNAIPKEHVIVFDEAQRAWDADQVAESQKRHSEPIITKTEPEHFIEFGDRIPEWSVIIGLIGSGQEIYKGEEAGLVQWRWAVEKSKEYGVWTIHAPTQAADIFNGSRIKFQIEPVLNLDTEIRNHMIPHLHKFIENILDGKSPEESRLAMKHIFDDKLFLYVTRDLGHAQSYVRNLYENNKDARFGLIASSRAKGMDRYGIRNDWHSTKNIPVGPWFSEPGSVQGSCCNFDITITEFQAQGLELDMSILCWGTDFVWENGKWDISRARGFQKGAKIKDPFQLRKNSYRVLLTRGRDGIVIFVPPDPCLDGTYNRLIEFGFKEIT